MRLEEILLLELPSLTIPEKRPAVKTRVFKLGKGLAVYIPKSIARKANLREDDWAEIDIIGRDHLQLHYEKAIPTLDELVARITPANRYPEI